MHRETGRHLEVNIGTAGQGVSLPLASSCLGQATPKPPHCSISTHRTQSRTSTHCPQEPPPLQSEASIFTVACKDYPSKSFVPTSLPPTPLLHTLLPPLWLLLWPLLFTGQGNCHSGPSTCPQSLFSYSPYLPPPQWALHLPHKHPYPCPCCNFKIFLYCRAPGDSVGSVSNS